MCVYMCKLKWAIRAVLIEKGAFELRPKGDERRGQSALGKQKSTLKGQGPEQCSSGVNEAGRKAVSGVGAF